MVMALSSLVQIISVGQPSSFGRPPLWHLLHAAKATRANNNITGFIIVKFLKRFNQYFRRTMKLKSLLDEKIKIYNHPGFIERGPVSIPNLFTQKQDIEIAGLFAAI